MIGVDYDLPLIYQNQSLKGVSNNFHLCVAPRDIEESFLNSIQASLSLYGQKRIVRISQFEDDDHLKERLLKIEKHNEPDCDAGVTIVGNISTSGTYIVHVPDDTCSPVLDKYCSYGIQSNIQQAVDDAFLQSSGSGGLVVELRPWDVGAPGSKPNSTEAPPRVGLDARYIIRSGQTPSRWWDLEGWRRGFNSSFEQFVCL
ncbi:hypothetical protein AVEN_117807-1 [Araneus ventricosus]|uniref:Uncharacterized protein n=1 Tax=Araneus ventricosus TaxID=182803 RepID=A0A4Y2BAD2_ARAVE|nr:hypothetical protein AVEN_117807-1 [Araneus ventricosus]